MELLLQHMLFKEDPTKDAGCPPREIALAQHTSPEQTTWFGKLHTNA